MQRKNYKAYFTVEAAVLYPIVLGVIVLMTYLLFFQYDRCLLEQDMGRAAVRSGSRWMQKKEELNRQLQEKDMFFDTEKYIAWESEESGNRGTDGKNALSVFRNSGSTQVLERKSRISGEEEQSGGDSAKQSEVSWEDGRNNRE